MEYPRTEYTPTQTEQKTTRPVALILDDFQTKDLLKRYNLLEFPALEHYKNFEDIAQTTLNKYHEQTKKDASRFSYANFEKKLYENMTKSDSNGNIKFTKEDITGQFLKDIHECDVDEDIKKFYLNFCNQKGFLTLAFMSTVYGIIKKDRKIENLSAPVSKNFIYPEIINKTKLQVTEITEIRKISQQIIHEQTDEDMLNPIHIEAKTDHFCDIADEEEAALVIESIHHITHDQEKGTYLETKSHFYFTKNTTDPIKKLFLNPDPYFLCTLIKLTDQELISTIQAYGEDNFIALINQNANNVYSHLFPDQIFIRKLTMDKKDVLDLLKDPRKYQDSLIDEAFKKLEINTINAQKFKGLFTKILNGSLREKHNEQTEYMKIISVFSLMMENDLIISWKGLQQEDLIYLLQDRSAKDKIRLSNFCQNEFSFINTQNFLHLLGHLRKEIKTLDLINTDIEKFSNIFKREKYYEQLVYLNLSSCAQLDDFYFDSNAIRQIRLNGCISLKNINLTSKTLKILSMDGCGSLNSIEKINAPNLLILEISNCHALDKKKLAEIIKGFKKLNSITPSIDELFKNDDKEKNAIYLACPGLAAHKIKSTLLSKSIADNISRSISFFKNNNSTQSSTHETLKEFENHLNNFLKYKDEPLPVITCSIEENKHANNLKLTLNFGKLSNKNTQEIAQELFTMLKDELTKVTTPDTKFSKIASFFANNSSSFWYTFSTDQFASYTENVGNRIANNHDYSRTNYSQ